MPLGKLEKVELRSIWPDEAQHFTPWLARPENIRVLGETLGMDLEVAGQEVSVGPFSADILCSDSSDGSKVVIENQIGPTDHTHMGQILTYAAGLGATTLIWIAARFRDEHRAVLDWLNEHTEENIAVFGLEIELWRIGDSQPAPKFNIVSKPNDWSKVVRSSNGADGQVSAHKQLQLEFWQAMREYAAEHGQIRMQKPAPQHWSTIGVGRSGFHLSAIVSTWSSESGRTGPEIRVDLVMNSPNAKQHFEQLHAMRDSLSSLMNTKLIWSNSEDAKSAKVSVRTESDFTDRSKWREQFVWLLDHMKLMRDVFGPVIRNLQP
jgi:hypothetical protein